MGRAVVIDVLQSVMTATIGFICGGVGSGWMDHRFAFAALGAYVLRVVLEIVK